MKSIFSRLILSFFAIIVVVIFSISFFFSGLSKNYLIRQKEADLKNKGSQIAELSKRYIDKQIDETTFLYLLNTIDELVNSRTVIIDSQGNILSISPRFNGRAPGPITVQPKKGMKIGIDYVSKLFSGSTIVRSEYNPIFNEPMITVGIPVYSDNEKSSIICAVVLNSPVTGINKVKSQTNIMFVWASIGALAFSLLASYFLSRTLSKPIHTISKAALEIAEGNYSKKVDIKRKDEIGNLASAFNYLTDKLNTIIGDLSNEKSKLYDILYSMEEGLVAVDNDLNIIHINPAALHLMNIEGSSAVQLQDIVPNGDIVENVKEVLETGKSKAYELSISDIKIISIIISPLKYKNEEIHGAIILLQDISESVKLERMRRDFVANVSHELRTPLTSIRGFIEPLVDGTVDDDSTRLKYQEIIRNETLRLERLINDLLDLSRLQSGRVDLDMQKVNIIELISNVSAKFQPHFDSKNIHFQFNKPDAPVFIYADGDRIEQLIIIFLDNAIKFTQGGGKISIKLVEEPELVRISISDNGAGIPEEDIPYIWDRFYKVDKSRSGKKSGTGLGLSIAKNIIELHGQKVSVQSKINEGTTFEFTMRKENS